MSSTWPDDGTLLAGPIPDIGGDPGLRAALQERVAREQIALVEGNANWVPQSSLLQGGPNPLAETPVGAVQGNLPKTGWTAQKDAQSPVFGPYAPTMVTPDWTDDANGIAAGAYDMNQMVGGVDAPNPLNRAPIGDNLFSMPSDVPNPNAPREDVTGTSGTDLEY